MLGLLTKSSYDLFQTHTRVTFNIEIQSVLYRRENGVLFKLSKNKRAWYKSSRAKFATRKKNKKIGSKWPMIIKKKKKKKTDMHYNFFHKFSFIIAFGSIFYYFLICNIIKSANDMLFFFYTKIRWLIRQIPDVRCKH